MVAYGGQFNCGLIFIMEGGIQEQQDLDMMAASTGDDYFNLKSKLYCKQVTGNVFDLAFLECVRRTTALASSYFTRILDMEREMDLEGEETSDPSYLFSIPTQAAGNPQ